MFQFNLTLLPSNSVVLNKDQNYCKHITQSIQISKTAKFSPNLIRFRVVKGLGEALREAKLRLSGVEETPACSEGECFFRGQYEAVWSSSKGKFFIYVALIFDWVNQGIFQGLCPHYLFPIVSYFLLPLGCCTLMDPSSLTYCIYWSTTQLSSAHHYTHLSLQSILLFF